MVFDPRGVARFAYGSSKDEQTLLYAADEGGAHWRKLATDTHPGLFTPKWFMPDGRKVLGHLTLNGGPAALAEADPGLTQVELLARDDFNSIQSLDFGSQQQPLAVTMKGAPPQVALFGPESVDAKLYRELSAGFPGQHIRPVDRSADGKVWLLYIQSDRNPGEWALMDRKTDKLSRLLQRNAALDPKQMGERRYLRFKARDGLELDAYMTLPLGTNDPSKLPMVLLPHGGPHGIFDRWWFDIDAQFLASRGYLVLQVNFRGSGDRGYRFRTAGYRNWGTGIQDDLIDALRWSIKQGYADPQRICIFGASFGAYSALMLAAKAPELVKCAAGLAGLYDLRAFANKSDVSRSHAGRAYIERVVGSSESEQLANSPLALARLIKAPVFLAHGEEDERTPYGQAEAMMEALKDAGRKPIWMSVPKEAHGFYNQVNVIAFYKQLEAFLTAHIGAGKSASD